MKRLNWQSALAAACAVALLMLTAACGADVPDVREAAARYASANNAVVVRVDVASFLKSAGDASAEGRLKINESIDNVLRPMPADVRAAVELLADNPQMRWDYALVLGNKYSDGFSTIVIFPVTDGDGFLESAAQTSARKVEELNGFGVVGMDTWILAARDNLAMMVFDGSGSADAESAVRILADAETGARAFPLDDTDCKRLTDCEKLLSAIVRPGYARGGSLIGETSKLLSGCYKDVSVCYVTADIANDAVTMQMECRDHAGKLCVPLLSRPCPGDAVRYALRDANIVAYGDLPALLGGISGGREMAMLRMAGVSFGPGVVSANLGGRPQFSFASRMDTPQKAVAAMEGIAALVRRSGMSVSRDGSGYRTVFDYDWDMDADFSSLNTVHMAVDGNWLLVYVNCTRADLGLNVVDPDSPFAVRFIRPADICGLPAELLRADTGTIPSKIALTMSPDGTLTATVAYSAGD